MTIIRTDSENKDFIELVLKLDEFITEMDGPQHTFYAQFNKLDDIKHVVVIFANEVPVSCGAIKPFSEDAMEVKRMFTIPSYRGRGMARVVLEELEKWAREMNYNKCVLETGRKF